MDINIALNNIFLNITKMENLLSFIFDVHVKIDFYNIYRKIYLCYVISHLKIMSTK